ncbi:MAG: cyclopropane-fatty-acyl-phospholipid synthase family protein [Candidatus Bipolaricaulia bacterium]
MEWIRQFYEKQDEWIGCCQGEIEGVDRERAACVHRLLAAEPGRVLELGCGGGQTAAAIAELGHTVVAVDISRRAIEAAGERARSVVSGRLIPVLADFFDYEPAGEFDAVVYFDGFGVGEDEDQRRLLHRMAAWMKEGAWALLDV